MDVAAMTIHAAKIATIATARTTARRRGVCGVPRGSMLQRRSAGIPEITRAPIANAQAA